MYTISRLNFYIFIFSGRAPPPTEPHILEMGSRPQGFPSPSSYLVSGLSMKAHSPIPLISRGGGWNLQISLHLTFCKSCLRHWLIIHWLFQCSYVKLLLRICLGIYRPDLFALPMSLLSTAAENPGGYKTW